MTTQQLGEYGLQGEHGFASRSWPIDTPDTPEVRTSVILYVLLYLGLFLPRK